MRGSRSLRRRSAKARRPVAQFEALEPRVVLSTVSGTVFNDADGDGIQNGRPETGLSGWRVYADVNGNGAYDTSGTPEPSSLTNVDGD